MKDDEKIKCNRIDKKLEDAEKAAKKGGTMPKFTYKAEDYKKIRRITDVNCANKEGKSMGGIGRVDAALSTDKSVLVIWCQLKDGGVQVSLYNMKAIRNFIAKPNKYKTFSLRKDGKKACISSVYYPANKVKDSALKPSNSFQSIDVSNKVGSDKYYVYICGGNEGDENTNGLQISRFTMKKNRDSISNERRILVSPQKRSNDPTNIEENNREIEGCHIVGKNLMFLITHAKTEDVEIKKDFQYICQIPKATMDDVNAKYS